MNNPPFFSVLLVLTLTSCLLGQMDSKLVSGSTRHSIIPPPPPSQEFDTMWISVVDSELDTNITLKYTPILTLPNLRDELSYNCLSNNFELALQIQDGSLTAAYHVEGNFDFYFGNVVRLTATGHFEFVCGPQAIEGQCLIILGGQLDPQSDRVIVDSLKVSAGVAIEYHITYGTWMGLPIVTWPQLVQAKASLAVLFDRLIFDRVTSDLKPYLNQQLSNTTASEFISMTGGDCETSATGENSKLAILPEFPSQLEFEKSYDYADHNGWFNMTLDLATTISDLTDLSNELSYNCLSQNLELALLIPHFSMEGPFLLAGLDAYMTEDRMIEVAGTMKITCAYPEPPGPGCLKRVFGKMVDNGRNVEAHNLTFSPRFFYDALIDYALVNGEPVDSIYLGDYLTHFWTQIYADWANFVGTQLNEKLANISMEQLLQIMGGDCGVSKMAEPL